MTFFCLGFEGFECSLVWIMAILLFFIAAIIRKHGGELLGIEFNLITSTIAAEILYIAFVLITKSFKWAFLVGLVGMLIGGFFGGQFFGGDSEGGYE